LLVTSIALDLPFQRRGHRIDYLGAALLVTGVTAILLVTVWGGNQYAWGSPEIVGLAVAGGALLVGFAFQERRAPEPVLPPRLFRDRVFLVAVAVLFVVGVAMFGGIIFLPLFLQVVTGASATNSGLQLIPLMLGIVVTSITAGRIISRTGRYKVFPVIGTAVMTVGLALLSTMDASTSRTVVAAYMVVLGAGLGMVMQVMILAVQNAVQRRDLGAATSAANFFRSMGGSFGVAIFGAIFTNRLAYHLPRLLPANLPGAGVVDASALQGSPGQIRTLPAPVQEAVVEAVARSLHVVFLSAVPVVAIGFLIVLLLAERPLRESAHIGATQPEPAAELEPASGRDRRS
jgi:predicted MFS family arabinose efflux permease